MAYSGFNVDVTKLYEIADKIVLRYKNRLKEIDAQGTGNLINSVKSDIDLKNQVVSLYLELLDYWQFVESGRGPSHGTGWANPIEDLSTWVMSKLQRGKFMPNPGHPLPTQPKEIKQVSWAIYKKITKKGYERTGDKAMPLQRTLDTSKDLLQEFAGVVADAFGQEVLAEFATLNNPGKVGTNKVQKIKTR